LIEVGGFDERFELNEDTDICARLREKRYKLLLDREIFVYHKRRTNMKDFARQFFWYGIGRMRSMLTSRRYIDKRILAPLLGAIFLALLTPISLLPILAALSGYSILTLCSSTIGARRIRAFGLMPRMFVLFSVEHLSYLVGLVCGTFLGPWNRNDSTDSMRLSRYQVFSNTVVEVPTEVFERHK
jgi:succinoglycan biosynthesis protein ExoA